MKIPLEAFQIISIPLGYYIGTLIGHQLFKLKHPTKIERVKPTIKI